MERHFRLALIQLQWNDACEEHRAAIKRAVGGAAAQGAVLVVLPELTLLPYFAAEPGRNHAQELQEDPETGCTAQLCRGLAIKHGIYIVASIFELGGYNTAIIVAPSGSVVGRCRKQHIPGSIGYGENEHFRSGGDAYPVFMLPLCGAGQAPVAVAVPTCYDQWFPELHRIYALRGAEVLIFPSAIGEERDAPDFDSSEPWRLAMRGQAVCNGVFVAACNRCSGSQGKEPEPGHLGGQRFYGRSFLCSPTGELIATADSEPRVVIGDCNLGLVSWWRTLFPLIRCRRPAEYLPLLDTSVHKQACRRHYGQLLVAAISGALAAGITLMLRKRRLL